MVTKRLWLVGVLSMPFFFIQLSKLASDEPYRLAMNFLVEPLRSRASIAGRNGSSLLFPGPLGLPNFTPAAFLALRASLVRAEIRSRQSLQRGPSSSRRL